jgi:hypothetical protein
MDKKHETINDPALFYCFAIFRKPTTTFHFYIVPNKVVATYVREEYQHWLREKRKEGNKGRNTDIRMFRLGFKDKQYPIVTPLAENYKDNWKSLGS